MTPKQVIAERIGEHQAAACIDLLKEAGWIVVRHDAIRLAQAHALNDNFGPIDFSKMTAAERGGKP